MRPTAALLALLLAGCGGAAIQSSSDGFPVIQGHIGPTVVSCKGTRCCWPWGEDVIVCAEPLEGGYLGAGGIIVTVRGKLP